MPKPEFPIKEIAFQSGLSLATVDRAIHKRAHVSAATKRRVNAAIQELSQQQEHDRLQGRKFVIDVIVEAPNRFSKAVQHAFEAELPAMRPASLRARFHMAQQLSDQDILTVLERVRKRGSHGVLIKARNTPKIIDALLAMAAKNIPVLTFVTDLPAANPQAYIGIDNFAAGQSAAWLMGKMLRATPATILATQSHNDFQGEADRIAGFAAVINSHFPTHNIVNLNQGAGISQQLEPIVERCLQSHPNIDAVYSAGGGNRAILSAFKNERRICREFGAHDLDHTNQQLLKDAKLSFVIHHDLRLDAHHAAQHFLKFHKMLASDLVIPASRFSVATPFG